MDNQMEILANNFLDSLKYQCTLNGIKYLFPKTPQVSYPGSGNIKCLGYFDDAPNPIIACALDKPTEDWLEILIHETCHMDQWIENIELWNNIKKDGIDCSVCMDDWLNGKDFTKEEYTHFIRTMQLVEIDCEKRSVDKIIHLDIPIDIEGYIKRANSYLFFYSVMLETRKWCDIAPYKIKEIVDVMPSHFLTPDEYKNVPMDLLKLYQKTYK